MYWVVSFVALIVLCSAHESTMNYTCDEGYNTCTTCFNMFVHKTITSDRNQYNLQGAFFPPAYSPPVYVIVHYFCEGNEDIPALTWFWSANIFNALFIPLTVHQYTSLSFSDPAYLNATLNLTLADECCDILQKTETMRLFTQRVRIV